MSQLRSSVLISRLFCILCYEDCDYLAIAKLLIFNKAVYKSNKGF